METAILAVVGVAIVAALLLQRNAIRDLRQSTGLMQTSISACNDMVSDTLEQAEQIRSVLTEASRIKAQREAEPAGSPPRSKFIGVAQRRAQAERRSLEPVTHSAKIAANNAKAMEGM